MELVSFCIPAYNAAEFIKKTINSILAQDHHALEIIVVDDHSTDETVEYLKEIKDSRLIFETAKSKGAAAARNQAFSLAKGKYVVFFDADDWIPSNFLASQIAHLKNENDVVVCNWGRFFNDDINTLEINSDQIRRDLSFEEWILFYWNTNASMTCPGRILMSKSLSEKTGKWDESLTLNDDFQFFSQLFSKSNRIKFNNDSVFYYRSGINGLSSKKGESDYASLYKSLRIGIEIALFSFPENLAIKKSCANLLKSFIYEVYPSQHELAREAELKIKSLGAADFEFPAGGKTKVLVGLLGWKVAKRLKQYFN